MSLIEEMYDTCVVVDRTTTNDGEGGVLTEWTDGAEIKAVITLDTTMQAQIAQAQGVKSVYTITTSKTIELPYGSVIKRLKDNKIFRITSDYSDKESPVVSNLDIRQVKAEKWSLTT